VGTTIKRTRENSLIQTSLMKVTLFVQDLQVHLGRKVSAWEQRGNGIILPSFRIGEKVIWFHFTTTLDTHTFPLKGMLAFFCYCGYTKFISNSYASFSRTKVHQTCAHIYNSISAKIFTSKCVNVKIPILCNYSSSSSTSFLNSYHCVSHVSVHHVISLQFYGNYHNHHHN